MLHIRGERTTLYSKNTAFLQVIFPLSIPFQVSLVPDIIQWWLIERFAGQVQCFYTKSHSAISDCSKLFPFTALIGGKGI